MANDKPAAGTSRLAATDILAVQEVRPLTLSNGPRIDLSLHALWTRQTLKLTQKQVQTCYEVLKWRFINREDEDESKQFRLEVKRRLFKLYAAELEQMLSSDRRKAFLETEFQALQSHYTQLLRRVQLWVE